MPCHAMPCPALHACNAIREGYNNAWQVNLIIFRALSHRHSIIQQTSSNIQPVRNVSYGPLRIRIRISMFDVLSGVA